MAFNSIDWGATGAMIAGIAALLQTAAIIYVAKAGQNVIADLRTQRQFDRKFRVADELLVAIARLDVATEIISLTARGMPPFRSYDETQAIIETAAAKINAECAELANISPLLLSVFGSEARTNLGFLISEARRITNDLSAIAYKNSDDDYERDNKLWNYLYKSKLGSGNAVSSYRHLKEELTALLTNSVLDNT